MNDRHREGQVTAETREFILLMGIDHERMTGKYQGPKFRLRDVHGKVVKGILPKSQVSPT